MKRQTKPHNGRGTEMPIRHLNTDFGISVPIFPLFRGHWPVSIRGDTAAMTMTNSRIMQGERA